VGDLQRIKSLLIEFWGFWQPILRTIGLYDARGDHPILFDVHRDDDGDDASSRENFFVHRWESGTEMKNDAGSAGYQTLMDFY
jgi:hypothetical protein